LYFTGTPRREQAVLSEEPASNSIFFAPFANGVFAKTAVARRCDVVGGEKDSARAHASSHIKHRIFRQKTSVIAPSVRITKKQGVRLSRSFRER